MSVTILGIESSCDDTSSSVIRDGVMLSNVIASQAVHEAYGGVVPELASRAHQQNIIPVVAEAIKRAVESDLGISCLSRLSLREAFRRGGIDSVFFEPLRFPDRRDPVVDGHDQRSPLLLQ